MTAAVSDTSSTLADLVADSSIIVCCGSGGVGKTTTAAVVALEGARLGRKTVVVTIDPAKRLADALGLEGLTDAPSRIDGDWAGELWATMLDTKSTFDALVVKYAASPEQGERILANRFYRNISGALSGTQEYMAMEKLYELHDETDFDLVVVDTPPTRHALDFLDAPRRLSRFLDHRLFEFSAALPTGSRLRGLKEKEILRRWARHILPARISGRGKQPYRAPDAPSFFAPNAPAYIADMLSTDAISRVGVWSPRAVQGLVRRCRSAQAISFRENQALLAVLSTQIWHHRFIQTASSAPALDVHGADVVLQARQRPRVFLRQQVGAARKHLPELHVGGTHGFQVAGQLLRGGLGGVAGSAVARVPDRAAMLPHQPGDLLPALQVRDLRCHRAWEFPQRDGVAR